VWGGVPLFPFAEAGGMSLRTGPMGGALDGLSAEAGLALPEKDRRTWE